MSAQYAEWTSSVDSFGPPYASFDQDQIPDEVVLVRGSSLKPSPVDWLWPGWLALGKVHILAGAPGQGKTTLAIAMAATITRGGNFPDGSQSPEGNVLIWSGEDDPADTLAPRLIACGGDSEKVFFITGTKCGTDTLPFDPARDIVKLHAAAEKIGGVKLLIVDPVVSAVAGDGNKNNDVRRALQPLVDLAAVCECAVLGITHFSKGGQGTDPTQRVLGSLAFTAVARVVMAASKIKGKDGEDSRLLVRTKSNIGPDGGGFNYQLEQTEALPGIQASRVTWGLSVEGTAQELLTDPNEAEDDDTEDAASLLRCELDENIFTACEIASAPLKAAGFSKKQIWAASKKLGVERKKDGVNKQWLWRLPFTGVRPQNEQDS
jgi:putative DNA primase/helicase